jgi:tetratricopeptide (TPR) repeat protein
MRKGATGRLSGLLSLVAFMLTAGSQAHADNFSDCNSGDTAKALKACTAVLDTESRDNTEMATAYLNRGWAHLATDENDKASSDLENAVRLNPENAAAWHGKGYYLYRTGNPAGALEAATKASELNPDFAAAFDLKGDAQFDLGDYDASIAAYDKAIALNTTDATLFYDRAFSHYRKGDYEAAERDFSESLRLNPNLAVGQFGLGLVRYDQKRLDEALLLFDKAVSLDDKLYQAHNGRGDVLYSNGLDDAAIQAFDKAITLKPDNGANFFDRGYVYLRKRDYLKALADFDEAIRLQPAVASYNAARGDALSNLESYPLALQAYDKSLELDPNSARNLVQRASILNSNLKLDQALTDIEKALALEPQNTDALTERARNRYGRDQFDLAVNDAEAALAINPGLHYTRVVLGLAQIWAGDQNAAIVNFDKIPENEPVYAMAVTGKADIFRQLGQIDEALAEYNKALSLNAKMSYALSGRGFASFAKGDATSALKDFDAAIKIDKLNGEAHYGRGDALAAMGKTKEAQAAWLAALEPFRANKHYQRLAEKALADSAGNAPVALLLEQPSVVETPPAQTVEEPVTETPTVEPLPAAQALAEPPVKAEPPPPAQVKITATPGKRLALVIGNGTYQFANPLTNPPNDMRAMTETLRKLDFEVISGEDLNHSAMQNTLRDFAQKSETADVVLFFYAGHGLQVGDRNYLIPIDAKLEEPTAIDFELFDVEQSVVKYMGGESKTGIVILDSCRNNPVARALSRKFVKTRSGSVSEGMAPMSADEGGLLIAFATAPREVAEDGDGKNSPFTTALVKHLATPGLELEQMMKRVKKEVYTATEKRQQPWVNSALREEIFLIGN